MEGFRVQGLEVYLFPQVRGPRGFTVQGLEFGAWVFHLAL